MFAPSLGKCLRSKNTRVLIANSAQVRPQWTREFAPSFSFPSYHETRNLKVCGRGGVCNLSLSRHNEKASTHQGHLGPQWVPSASHLVIQVESKSWGFVGKIQFSTFKACTRAHTHTSHDLMKAMQMQDCLKVSHKCRAYRLRVMICTWNHTDW